MLGNSENLLREVILAQHWARYPLCLRVLSWKTFLQQWKRALVHPSAKLRHPETKVWQREGSKPRCESQRFPQGASKPFSGEL